MGRSPGGSIAPCVSPRKGSHSRPTEKEGTMKARVAVCGFLFVLLASPHPAGAQLARTDAIWARSAPPGSITLDGNLNEPVLAAAESWRIHYAYDVDHPVTGTMGISGSCWTDEGC